LKCPPACTCLAGLSDSPDKKPSPGKSGADPGAPRPLTPKPLQSRPAPATPRPLQSKPPAPTPAAATPPKPTEKPAPSSWATARSAPATTPPPARKPPPGANPTASPADKPAQRSAVSDELAAALAALAAENAVPTITNAPFVTAAQREAEALALKKARRVRILKFIASGLVIAVLIHLAATQFFFAAPTDEVVAAYVQQIAEDVLPLYSTANQPLQIDTATAVSRDRVDSSHQRFVAEVTLRLRKPLYVPGATNGTIAYRQLQESLQIAVGQELKFKLFPTGDGPVAPTMPPLLQMSHPAGDAVVVRVPFDAVRFGWSWRLKPAQLALRTSDRDFTGTSLDRYANTAYLIFGGTGMAEIRARMRAAREYILAVNKEVRKHADVEAVADIPGVNPDAPAVSLGKMAVNPDAPAVDPDAPAKPAAPAPDTADKPAVDPDAPAQPEMKIEVPGLPRKK
jgi:hypothetical protein